MGEEDKFDLLGAILDRYSYEIIEGLDPEMASEIARLAQSGVEPGDIRSFFLQRGFERSVPMRAEQAARHIRRTT